MTTLALRAATLVGGTLADVARLSGGSLSEVVRLRLADGRELIAKHFDPTGVASAPREAEMLRAIAATGAPAPDILGVSDDLLVMAALPADGQLSGRAWASLADQLRALHQPQRRLYGWDGDHAFATVAIVNTRGESWPDFWGAHRLACHLPHIDATLRPRLEQVIARIDTLLPQAPPAALLHGDLWGGNVLVSGGRVTGLIDPACAYGDREVDVAMLTLFDHPPPAFLEALDLPPGWRDRLPVYRLWPLLVHLRLFGPGYHAPVSAALDALGV